MSLNSGFGKKSSTAKPSLPDEYKLPEQVSAKFTNLLQNITDTKEGLGGKEVSDELKTLWGSWLFDIVDLGNKSMFSAAEQKEEANKKKEEGKKEKKEKKEKKGKKSKKRRLRRRMRRM